MIGKCLQPQQPDVCSQAVFPLLDHFLRLLAEGRDEDIFFVKFLILEVVEAEIKVSKRLNKRLDSHLTLILVLFATDNLPDMLIQQLPGLHLDLVHVLCRVHKHARVEPQNPQITLLIKRIFASSFVISNDFIRGIL